MLQIAVAARDDSQFLQVVLQLCECREGETRQVLSLVFLLLEVQKVIVRLVCKRVR